MHTTLSNARMFEMFEQKKKIIANLMSLFCKISLKNWLPRLWIQNILNNGSNEYKNVHLPGGGYAVS